jgi:hypothetical protein
MNFIKLQVKNFKNNYMLSIKQNLLKIKLIYLNKNCLNKNKIKLKFY